MGRILSGIKPTGGLTLGNYLGALKPWVQMQYDHENFFMLADLHTINAPIDPAELRHNTYELVAAYIASGLDTKHNAMFVQSHITAHAELSVILECYTPMGWLKRMTQFKDKAGKNQDSVSTGLFTYPVLMAADILLYDTTHVPVGDDQKQHVELTRDIANSFNQRYNTECFKIPEPVIGKEGARIKSLRDGTKKMSKSDASDMSRINMIDDVDTIRDKIKRARTDTGVMPSSVEEFAERPEVQNLIEIYALLADISVQDVITRFDGQQFAPFKAELGDLVADKIAPIGQHMQELLQDTAALDAILADGANRARAIASQTLRRVQDAVGFVLPRS
jgi:tryptophanyl-tRNA synthetase